MKREYGIDLLKMVAMMMVIAHHILLGGGVSAKLHEKWGGRVLNRFSIVSVIARSIVL